MTSVHCLYVLDEEPIREAVDPGGLQAHGRVERLFSLVTATGCVASIMSLLRPLDPAFPIERQIAIDASPVVLVNVFTLDKADERTFLRAWQDDATFMKRRPGFISTQLHTRDRRKPDVPQLCGLGVDR